MTITASTTPSRVPHPWVAEAGQRVRFGVFHGPMNDWPTLISWAKEIEQLGFDSLWIGDHPAVLPLECWTALAVLASHTEHLRLGSLVSCVYYRPALVLARQATDVDRLSNGRVVLGLGIGDIPKEFEQLGLGDPPLRARDAALVETIQLIRDVWRGDRVTLDGTHVHAHDAAFRALPVQQPHVPLLIAGGGEKRTLRRVAEFADMSNFGPSGATGSAWGLPEVRRKLDALRRHCADVGRPYDSVLRSHLGGVVVAETEAALDAKVAARLRSRGAAEAERLPGMPRVITSHYEIASVEHIATTLVAGTPAQLVTYYRSLVEAGMRYFIAQCGQDRETLRLLAEQVAPHVS